MARQAAPQPTGNRLLDLLPPDEHQRLLPLWKKLPLAHGYELCKQDGPMSYVYFPISGVCSVVSVTDKGELVEATAVGNEGMIGIPVVLGLDFSPSKAISQVAGEALRLPARAFVHEMEPGSTLDRLLRRYIAFSLRYAHQTVACNTLHSVEERMCRWLLITHDRVGADQFKLTQEFLSIMLGVRRQTVTVIAGTLQTAGFISYRRGVIRITDRKGLEDACCECYETTNSYYQRIVK